VVLESAGCDKVFSAILTRETRGAVARFDLVGFESKRVGEGPRADLAGDLRWSALHVILGVAIEGLL
jgi:hypothetical protein